MTLEAAAPAACCNKLFSTFRTSLGKTKQSELHWEQFFTAAPPGTSGTWNRCAEPAVVVEQKRWTSSPVVVSL